MSNFYYKGQKINDFLLQGPTHETTNFIELDNTDMGQQFGVYNNDTESTGNKALYIYSDLGYNYLSGSSYINIALISQPQYSEYTSSQSINIPSWCNYLYIFLIGGGGGGNSSGSSYPGGGGEFGYGCVPTTPSSTIYCSIGEAGYSDRSNGGDTSLNTGSSYNANANTILAIAKGGEMPGGTTPGSGGAGGKINGTSVILKSGCYSNNNNISAPNGMKNQNIESGTTITDFSGNNVLHYGLQNTEYGYGGVGAGDGNPGYVRIYFSP